MFIAVTPCTAIAAIARCRMMRPSGASQSAIIAPRVTIEDFEAGLGENRTGFIGNFVSRPIDRKLCDDWRSQKEELPARPGL